MASIGIEMRNMEPDARITDDSSHLRDESARDLVSTDPGEFTSHSLPPVDGGKKAWLFLLGCFMMDGIVWGFPLSFGVFQVYYSTHEPFSHSTGQRSGIAAIGTTATGLAYFASPLCGIVMQRYPHTRRPAMYIGLVGMVFGLVGASLCSTVAGLIATQGMLYGIGCILLYFPATLFLDEWFVKRKAFAYGISWSGTGTAGVVVPFIMQWLLDSYGFRSTLRIWAVVLVILATPCLYLVQPRLPLSIASALRPQDFTYMKHYPFWIYQFGNVAQSLGAFLPLLWMPAYAITIGLPQYAGPLSVAFYNGGVSVGTVILGSVTDRYHVTFAILICTLGSMVAAFVFWGLASSAPMLYLFAIIWGFFTGGFNSTWPGCAAAMRRMDHSRNLDTGVLIGMMAAGKGIGGVVGGPLSEKLLELGWHAKSHFAYGTSYGVLVVFCGLSAAFGGAACVGRVLKMV